MKCDELKAYTLFTTSSLSGQRVYLTNKVDEAIAELKAENADLNHKLHDLSEHAMDASGKTVDKVSELKEAIRIKDELLIENGKQIGELKAENKRLKKCEIWMKQHFYCEEVIACESAKNRKMKRALWLARAEMAKARKTIGMLEVATKVTSTCGLLTGRLSNISDALRGQTLTG